MAGRCAECGKRKSLRARGMCDACYSRVHRAENPTYAENSRIYSRAWKARNRERTREYDHQYAATHRGVCSQCDGPMDRKRDGGICSSCRAEGARVRRQTLQTMWNSGAPLAEIAAALATTVNVVGTEMAHMRADGWDLPYRYRRRAAA